MTAAKPLGDCDANEGKISNFGDNGYILTCCRGIAMGIQGDLYIVLVLLTTYSCLHHWFFPSLSPSSLFLDIIKLTETNSTSLLLLLLHLFSFYQGQKMLVENSDNYTLTAISREATGEYKCSLADNEKVEASQSIVVSCEYS